MPGTTGSPTVLHLQREFLFRPAEPVYNSPDTRNPRQTQMDLLDGELFLPDDWAEDRERCRAAGIPNEVDYRPKWEIALHLYDRAQEGGVCFDWLVFDEGYGGKPPFLRALCKRGQSFVGEVPRTFTAWIKPPRVTRRGFSRRRGRSRKTPRLVSGSYPAITVENMLKYSPALRDQPWVRYHVKDSQKGPIIWEVKRTKITIKDEDGLPGEQLDLVVARNVLNTDELKFFVCKAPPETVTETLLLVGFSRWRVERCFQDGQQEVGLDQWEGRRWLGLKRHLILTSVTYLFMARVREKLKKAPELTVSQVHIAVGALVRSWWLHGRASPALIKQTAKVIQHWQQRIAAARKSHTKQFRKKLRKMGIKLKDLISCKWP